MKGLDFNSLKITIIISLLYVMSCAIAMSLALPGMDSITTTSVGLGYAASFIAKGLIAAGIVWFLSVKTIAFKLAFNIIILSAWFNQASGDFIFPNLFS